MIEGLETYLYTFFSLSYKKTGNTSSCSLWIW